MKKYAQQFHILGLILVLLAVVFFVVRPLRADIVTLRDDIFTQREELEKMYLRGQLLKKTQVQLQEIEADIPLIESVVLSRDKQLELITALELIASNNSLSQEIAMDALPDDITDVTSLPISVKLGGTFDGLLGYMSDVEQQNFYVNWQSVSVGSGVGTQRTVRRGPNLAPDAGSIIGNQSISITLVGETYWKP